MRVCCYVDGLRAWRVLLLRERYVLRHDIVVQRRVTMLLRFVIR